MNPSPSFGRKAASWLVRLGILSLSLGPAAPGAAGTTATASPAAWSQGTKLCEGGKLQEGWSALAAIERSAGKKPLPPAYWRDVIGCAVKAGMPAHALRAGKMLDDQKATTDADRALLATAKARTRTPDPRDSLTPGEAWVVRTRANGRPEVASTPCGFAFEPPADPPLLPPANRGACSVRIYGPPLRGKAGPQTPSLIVLARVAGPNEKPEDYAKRVLPTWKPAKLGGLRCPGANCTAFSITIPGMFGKDGDGVGFAIAFEREQPEFPGLALEKPLPVVKPPDGSTPYGRYQGKMLFVLELDVAASLVAPAQAQFQKFLSGLAFE